MSLRETIEWRAFEEDFGPVTLHERIDAAAALICYTIWRAAGHDGDLEDFAPRWGTSGELPSAFEFLTLNAREA